MRLVSITRTAIALAGLAIVLIVVGPAGPASSQANAPAQAPAAEPAVLHRVNRGETVWLLERCRETTREEIAALNPERFRPPASFDWIKKDEWLWLPPVPDQIAVWRTLTLGALAGCWDTSMEAIAAANRDDFPDRASWDHTWVGQVLRSPPRLPEPTPAPPEGQAPAGDRGRTAAGEEAELPRALDSDAQRPELSRPRPAAAEEWSLGLALGAVALVVAVEHARRRLTRLSDDEAAGLLGRALPVAAGLIAGAAYSYTYAVIIAGRPLGEQIGWTDGAPLYGVAVFAYGVTLVASAVLARRSPIVRRHLGATCLGAGGLAMVAIPFVGTAPVLIAAIALAGAAGAGSTQLKCRVAGLAEAQGKETLTSATRWLMWASMLALSVIPSAAGLLVRPGRLEVGGIGGVGLVFVVLGGAMLSASRLLPPLLRDAVASGRERQDFRGPIVWRSIAITSLSIAALGGIDAGLVEIIADHAHVDSESWAGLLLFPSLFYVAVFGGETIWEAKMRHPRRTIVFWAAFGLVGAILGAAVGGLAGWPWLISFSIAYIVMEPSTSLLLMAAETIVLRRNPNDYHAVALLQGGRLWVKALPAGAFALGGEPLSWAVAIALWLLTLAIALPPWTERRAHEGFANSSRPCLTHKPEGAHP